MAFVSHLGSFHFSLVRMVVLIRFNQVLMPGIGERFSIKGNVLDPFVKRFAGIIDTEFLIN